MFQEHDHSVVNKDTAPCRPSRRRSFEDMQGYLTSPSSQNEENPVVSETDSPVRKERKIERSTVKSSGDQLPSLLNCTNSSYSAVEQPQQAVDLTQILAQAPSLASPLDRTSHGAATSALNNATASSLSYPQQPRRKRSKLSHHGSCSSSSRSTRRCHSHPKQALPTITEFQKFSSTNLKDMPTCPSLRRRQSLRSYTRLLDAMSLSSNGNLAGQGEEEMLQNNEEFDSSSIAQDDFPKISWQDEEE